jgi:hypothetical protein
MKRIYKTPFQPPEIDIEHKQKRIKVILTTAGIIFTLTLIVVAVFSQ